MRLFIESIILLTLIPITALAQIDSIPAELGGPGFERVAASMGWRTAAPTEQELRLLGDARALKGGALRFPVDGFPTSFRPYGASSNSIAARLITDLVYEPLVGINPLTLEPMPALASHWKIDPADSQTYWFRIDPNARFSDGAPVTTDDVIATYQLGVDPMAEGLYTSAFYGGFERPEAISPYIFKVRSKERNWKNMLYFGGTIVMPAHVVGPLSGWGYLSQNGMVPGSGPYVIAASGTTASGDTAIVMTRRKDWWRSAYPAVRGNYNFDTLVMVSVSEEKVVERLRGSEIDLAPIGRARAWKEELSFDEVKRGLIQKRKVYTAAPIGVGGIVFNMRHPPFDEEPVREAFIHLFNRERLVSMLMRGEYTLTDSYYPGSPYENPNNPRYRYEPELALRLLAEAGYDRRNNEGILVRGGEPFVVEMPVTEGMEGIIEPVRQELLRAGIRLELRRVTQAMNFKLLNERNFDIGWMDWNALLFPNPISSFHSTLADVVGTNNIAGYRNQQADTLMEREQTTADPQERIAILRRLDSMLVASKQYALSWHAPFQRIAYWNRFGQPDYYLGRIDDWQSAIRLWWYDAARDAAVERARKRRTAKMDMGKEEVRGWEGR